jgi:uncharacterized damage-inducible protein DinB
MIRIEGVPMTKNLALLAALVLVPAIVTAQTPPVRPIMASLGGMYASVAADLSAAAERMPEESYEYRPTAAVRSFGQIVAHVAGAQFLYCAQAAGALFDRELLAKLGPMRRYSEAPAGAPDVKPPSKSALVALLNEGIAYCASVYATTTDAAAAKPVTMGGRETIRGRPLFENVAHNNEHYGNLVTYLRVNGLVPPSTERRVRTQK